MFCEEDWGDSIHAKDLEKSLFSHHPHITTKGSKCLPTVAAVPSNGPGNDLSKRKRKRNRTKRKRTDGASPAQTPQLDTVKCDNDNVVPERSKKLKYGKIGIHNNGMSNATPQPKHAEDIRKRKKLMKMMNASSSNNGNVQTTQNTSPTPQSLSGKQKSRSELLRERVSNKLQGSKFRFINEQLYSRTGAEASKLFSKDPSAFTAYHDGFTQQVAKWPINPLDKIITYIKKRPPKWVIGDFGCGDARLAASVKNKVYSFDLVASNDRVTAADIAHVPISDECLDVAVFCLSLMGTNFIEFLREANRTLKMKGLLKIAEVSSRFTSISKFINLLKSLGFALENQEREDSHFYAFDFRKVRSPQAEIKTTDNLLKPCVYKKR